MQSRSYNRELNDVRYHVESLAMQHSKISVHAIGLMLNFGLSPLEFLYDTHQSVKKTGKKFVQHVFGKFVHKSSIVLTAFCLSGTNSFQIRCIDACRFGVGSY